MMGITTVMTAYGTDDNGMHYELHEAVVGASGFVEVIDEDSGNVASVTQFPTVEAARAAFDKAVG